jgi:cysteine desulfurase
VRYFDANATTPLHPAARAAWLAAQDAHWQNAAAFSAGGVRANVVLEECRARLAARFAPKMKIVFTGGATEANNAVIASEAALTSEATGHGCGVSALEHASVREPAAKFFGARMWTFLALADGTADLDALEARLKQANGTGTLVSLMAVNNETGVVQPVREAVAIAHRYGARVHCDASQAFGKLSAPEVAVLTAGCDYVVGCAHKFGGQKGVGFLAFNPETCPRFCGQCGGGQEDHRRAGTVDTPGIAAMLAALEAAEREAADTAATARRRQARVDFEEEVCGRVAGTVVNGAKAAAGRVWNTTSLTLPRHGNLRWLKRLERRGFVVATGSACAATEAPGTPSRVLSAMGISADAAARTVRVSAWYGSVPEELAALAVAFAEVAAELDAESVSSETGDSGSPGVISVR